MCTKALHAYAMQTESSLSCCPCIADTDLHSIVWDVPWAWILEWHESQDDFCGRQQALEVTAISEGDVSR